MTGNLVMLAIVNGVLTVLREFIRKIIRKIIRNFICKLSAATCHD